MYGVVIKRYCSTCDKEVKIHASVGYMVEDKTYFTGHFCESCGEDLCKEDQRMLEKARKNGKSISAVMH